MAVPDLIQFVNGTAADADEVNQNNNLLSTYIDTDCMVLDGSKTFTGNIDFGGNQLLRVATPTADTDGANKAYADTVIPVGVVQMFAGSDANIPPKWVKCNGQELNRTTYSALFNVIGETYGNGNGTNTFNVPNFTGSAATGTPNADGVLRFPYPAAPGSRGGSHDAVVVTHNHTQNSHNHTQAAHNHGHSLGTNGGNHTHEGRDNGFVYWSNSYGSGSGSQGEAGSVWALSWQKNTDGTGAHSHGITGSISNKTATNNAQTATNQPAGESGTGKNIPAYLGVNFIIRTGV
jgi:microcystin-dependent protein